jgi:hypothetical protein
VRQAALCPLPRTLALSREVQREAVVVQSLSASVWALNTNSRVFQRWPQQASPSASTASAAQLVPSFATHQACAAGPSKSGLPHTPAALSLGPRRPPRQARQCTLLRCVGASHGQGHGGAGSKPASFQAGGGSFSSSQLFVALICLQSSNARQARPAEIHWPAASRRASSNLRANPSVKGTKCGEPHFAPYVER